MRELHQVAASQLGVGVWYQKGLSRKGFYLLHRVSMKGQKP